MLYIVILIIVALVGNFLIRKLLAAEDKISAPSEDSAPAKQGAPTVEQIISSWGKSAEAPLPDRIKADFGTQIRELLDKYESIAPDAYFPVISRSFLTKAPVLSGYWQIGAWGDGSEILIKGESADPVIYIMELEDDLGKPRRFSKNIEEYLKQAWLYHEDALMQQRKMKPKKKSNHAGLR